MKTLLLSIACSLILLTACNNNQSEANSTTPATATITKTTDKAGVAAPSTTATTWIDDFKVMRDAIFNKQKEVVASYFNFPITKNSDVMWSLTNEITEGPSKPFGKPDFIKFFDQIFNKEMVATLQKIKSDDLFKTGSNATPLIKGKDVTSSMTATFDKQTNKLKLQLSQEFYQEEGTGGESDTIFEFDVKDNKLKFNNAVIAG